MMSGGGRRSIDDPFEEVLSLIDEFDSADLSDITQRTAGVEFHQCLRGYKESSKKIRKFSRKMSSDVREEDVKIRESQSKESSLKEETTSLKRKINQMHSQLETINGELKDLKTINRELSEAIKTRKISLEEVENNFYMLLFYTAFAKKRRLLNLLKLRRNKVVFAVDSRSSTIKYVPFDERKALTAISCNELTNENGSLSNSVRSQGNCDECSKVEDGSENSDAGTDVSDMECE